MDIRENTKILARRKGLTLGAIAEKLGVSRQALNDYFSGNSRLSTYERLAGVLGVDLWVLFHPDPLHIVTEGETPAEGESEPTGTEITAEGLKAFCPVCKSELVIFPTLAGGLRSETINK